MLAVIFGLSVPEFAKWAVIITGIVAVAWIAMKANGITPPPWLVQMFWVVVVCFVAILCIGLLASM